MSDTSQLNAIIEQMVDDKVFKGEAITRIADIQKEGERMAKRIEILEESLEKEKAKHGDTKTEVNRAKAGMEQRDETIKDLRERVQDIVQSRQDTAVAQAESAVYGKCFELVFRNQQVHRQVSSSVPVAELYDNGCGGQNTVTTPYKQTEEITEEVK